MKTKFLPPLIASLAVLSACNDGASSPTDDNQTAAADESWPEGAPRYASRDELPAPWNEADLAAGEAAFQNNCVRCHAVTPGTPSTLGPHLHGVFARAPGGLETHDYSPAMDEFAATTDMTYWIPEEVDEWLANPRSYLPQSAMFFDGLADETQRRDLIGWLMIESSK